jgi:hypothetical protein
MQSGANFTHKVENSIPRGAIFFAVFKIDKKFCLGLFLAQKHVFDIFITPKPPKNEFQFLQKI